MEIATELRALRHIRRSGMLGLDPPGKAFNVARAAVIGVDDEEFGKRLAAFVVPKPDASLSEDDVREFVKDHLARFKIPRDVSFLDELPRNPTGKVLKRRLRDLHRAEHA